MILTAGDRAGRGRQGTTVRYWQSARHASSPNATIPVHQWIVYDPLKTDIDAMIAPKGTGSFMVSYSRPDSTTTGGNKRGLRAIDLQLNNSRTNANQVAGTDDTVIIGGRRNRTSESGAGKALYSAIVGGDTNYIASSGGTTGNASFLGGGAGVTIDMSGGANARAYIGGNTVAFSGSDTGGSGGVGGSNISITSPYVFVGACEQATANARGAMFGAYTMLRNAPNGLAIGAGGGGDASIGVAQITRFPYGRITSDATPTNLTTDSSSTAASQITVPAAFGGVFHGFFWAESSSNSQYQAWEVKGALYNVAGTLTLAAFSAATSLGSVTIGAATLALAVDTANRRLNVVATGIAATTIRWTGWIDWAERN